MPSAYRLRIFFGRKIERILLTKSFIHIKW